jgi:hypothetical protein
METNIDQNTNTEQAEGKRVGGLRTLALFTGFILIIVLLFYGINWIIS